MRKMEEQPLNDRQERRRRAEMTTCLPLSISLSLSESPANVHACTHDQSVKIKLHTHTYNIYTNEHIYMCQRESPMLNPPKDQRSIDDDGDDASQASEKSAVKTSSAHGCMGRGRESEEYGNTERQTKRKENKEREGARACGCAGGWKGKSRCIRKDIDTRRERKRAMRTRTSVVALEEHEETKTNNIDETKKSPAIIGRRTHTHTHAHGERDQRWPSAVCWCCSLRCGKG